MNYRDAVCANLLVDDPPQQSRRSAEKLLPAHTITDIPQGSTPTAQSSASIQNDGCTTSSPASTYRTASSSPAESILHPRSLPSAERLLSLSPISGEEAEDGTRISLWTDAPIEVASIHEGSLSDTDFEDHFHEALATLSDNPGSSMRPPFSSGEPNFSNDITETLTFAQAFRAGLIRDSPGGATSRKSLSSTPTIPASGEEFLAGLVPDGLGGAVSRSQSLQRSITVVDKENFIADLVLQESLDGAISAPLLSLSKKSHASEAPALLHGTQVHSYLGSPSGLKLSSVEEVLLERYHEESFHLGLQATLDGISVLESQGDSFLVSPIEVKFLDRLTSPIGWAEESDVESDIGGDQPLLPSAMKIPALPQASSAKHCPVDDRSLSLDQISQIMRSSTSIGAPTLTQGNVAEDEANHELFSHRSSTSFHESRSLSSDVILYNPLDLAGHQPRMQTGHTRPASHENIPSFCIRVIPPSRESSISVSSIHEDSSFLSPNIHVEDELPDLQSSSTELHWPEYLDRPPTSNSRDAETGGDGPGKLDNSSLLDSYKSDVPSPPRNCLRRHTPSVAADIVESRPLNLSHRTIWTMDHAELELYSNLMSARTRGAVTKTTFNRSKTTSDYRQTTGGGSGVDPKTGPLLVSHSVANFHAKWLSLPNRSVGCSINRVREAWPGGSVHQYHSSNHYSCSSQNTPGCYPESSTGSAIQGAASWQANLGPLTSKICLHHEIPSQFAPTIHQPTPALHKAIPALFGTFSQDGSPISQQTNNSPRSARSPFYPLPTQNPPRPLSAEPDTHRSRSMIQRSFPMRAHSAQPSTYSTHHPFGLPGYPPARPASTQHYNQAPRFSYTPRSNFLYPRAIHQPIRSHTPTSTAFRSQPRVGPPQSLPYTYYPRQYPQHL